MCRMVVQKPQTDLPPPFPLETGQLSSTSIGQVMTSELEASWEAYHSIPAARLACNITEIVVGISKLWEDVKYSRETLQNFILNSTMHIPKDVILTSSGWHGPAFRLFKLSNLVPTVGLSDLLPLALNTAVFQDFNPFLSAKACDCLQDSVLLWLQLCVLEDKLGRLASSCKEQNQERLISELLVVRTWDVRSNVEWLVMEVEGCLQIRPKQYIVARQLIDSLESTPNGSTLPGGAIGQLNMGEGKTRVILPMLVLHFAKKKNLIRLHFLSQLLCDAFEHLHRYLCASALNRKIFLLPFNRDLRLTLGNVQVLIQNLVYCRDSGGCVCVAPEHRLSLALKWHELRRLDRYNDVCDELTQLEQGFSYLDIFDESDEILRHNYQLIYAVGDKMVLPGGPSRWFSAQAVLRVIDRAQRRSVGAANSFTGSMIRPRKAANNVLLDIIQNDRAVVPERRGELKHEMFRRIRLLTCDEVEYVVTAFVAEIGRQLVENPPYELRWILSRGQGLHAQILSFIIEPSTLEETRLLEVLGSGTKEMEDLIALRGLLACGLLVHCLFRRHRVDFGIKRPGKKRLAVPFRAADTPSERSEFGHPDGAIVYTVLAYYDDGLNNKELMEAFKALLRLAPTVQSKIYQEWFDLSRHSMSPEDRHALDSVIKIDLSNDLQVALLNRFYGHNFETINFWLSNVVLPVETQQYPKRLIQNAWDLCSNKVQRPVGFSGTDDNRMLLPLQVAIPYPMY